jgi:hypothetical protein
MSETLEPGRVVDKYTGRPHYFCDTDCPQHESDEPGPGRRGCLLMPDEWEGVGGYCGPAYFAQRMIREKTGMR